MKEDDISSTSGGLALEGRMKSSSKIIGGNGGENGKDTGRWIAVMVRVCAYNRS